MSSSAGEWRVASVNPELGASNYTVGARDSVGARWKPYTRATPYEDIHMIGILAAKSQGNLELNSRVVDAGASDGELALKLRDMGFHGSYMGIDRIPDLSAHESSELLSEADWHRAQEDYPDLFAMFEDLLKFQGERTAKKLWTPSDMIELRKGRAEDMHDVVPDNSVDALFAFFMLYHLDEGARRQAYEEFLRILKPDGVFVVATSGRNNKPLSRSIEIDTAKYLTDKTGQKILAPPYMNANFTSESAPGELETYFPYRYEHAYNGVLTISSFERLKLIISSALTMENQFVPAVDSATYKEAVNYVVRQKVLGALATRKPLVEHFIRTLLICSQIPLDASKLDGFVTLPRSKK